ncbi:glycosyltransferase family 2 protein [Qipengyuania atrilutea]|uniref:glycosyltransferase family 2 protein n=1 Tax=Qipengyuania atrilutea TaxID=2744473 RepID=UPI001C3D3D72|nr:glycosyltransferase family 2 protein [Actirhodobacter atriluteus]
MRHKYLSLVVPVFNEADVIPIFLKRMNEIRSQVLDSLGANSSMELVFINDGSSDGSRQVIEAFATQDTSIKLVNLSRNFGKEAALSAGLHYSQGDAVVPLDVDLQDPPEIMLALIREWQAGAQVVNARRTDRSRDGLFKRCSAKVFYWLLRRISDHPVHEHVGDFRLLDRKAVDVLNQMSENTRFNKGLFSWIGFRVATVEYARPERAAGSTKWTFPRLWALAADGITTSSTLPLRIWTYIGGLIALLSMGYATWLVIYTFTTGIDTPGYASTMVAVLMLGGLNLLSLGLIGEYLGRVAIEVRGRPLFIVESTRGL